MNCNKNWAHKRSWNLLGIYCIGFKVIFITFQVISGWGLLAVYDNYYFIVQPYWDTKLPAYWYDILPGQTIVAMGQHVFALNIWDRYLKIFKMDLCLDKNVWTVLFKQLSQSKFSTKYLTKLFSDRGFASLSIWTHIFSQQENKQIRRKQDMS